MIALLFYDLSISLCFSFLLINCFIVYDLRVSYVKYVGLPKKPLELHNRASFIIRMHSMTPTRQMPKWTWSMLLTMKHYPDLISSVRFFVETNLDNLQSSSNVSWGATASTANCNLSVWNAAWPGTGFFKTWELLIIRN